MDLRPGIGRDTGYQGQSGDLTRVASSPYTPQGSTLGKRAYRFFSNPKVQRALWSGGTSAVGYYNDLHHWAATKLQNWWRNKPASKKRKLKNIKKTTRTLTMGRMGRKAYRRRKRFSRVQRGLPGLNMSGSKLMKCKFVGCFLMNTGSTDVQNLKIPSGPLPAAGETVGILANDLYQPGRNINRIGATQATTDAWGTNSMQMFWKRYKVVKSTITCVVVRNPSDGNEQPLMCGINITEPSADERNAGDTAQTLRGTDLNDVSVGRDSYRLSKGLIGAGKTTIVHSSTNAPMRFSATFKASKFNRGQHIDPQTQWADTVRETTSNQRPGDGTALNNLSPASPDKLIYFQPWVCNPTTNGAGTNWEVRCQYTVTYYVAAREKRARSGVQN